MELASIPHNETERQTTIIARVDGEEFVCLIPSITRET